MSDNEQPEHKEQMRIAIIETVQTPLGFFVLVVLVVEAIFGVFALRLNEGSDRTFLMQSMVALIFILVIIVAGLTLWRPETVGLRARQQTETIRYSLLIGPPEDLRNLDITNINWDNDECFLICGDSQARINLVRSRVGPTFRVEIPAKVLKRIKDEAISLELKDKKGNRWEVKSFYLFENLLSLSLVESKAKIIQDYGDEAQ